MTYRRVCIGESGKFQMADVSVEREPPMSVKDKPVHCPEIVTGRKHYTVTESNRKGALRISLGKVIFSVLLCSVSFAIGCSVTNDELAQCIEAISMISSGKSDEANGQLTENVTFYEKYMTEEDSVGAATPIEFLSSDVILPAEEQQIPWNEPVLVSGVSQKNTFVDGEELFEVVAQDMSVSDVHVISNQTKYKPDTEKLMLEIPKAFEHLTISQGEPLVLVLHTHGTECYNSYGNEGFTSQSTPVRSEDINENVVGVGRKLVSVLTDFGIPSVHSEKMCDSESFVRAYSTSYAEVQNYLEKYPSIRFVIDLHRDAIELPDGTRKKPVSEAFGKKTAQLMFVVGTNEAGANHPLWKENLSLALFLQNEIGRENPKLFRSTNLRTASFNQQLSTGYMLLECGSAANTLEEAENAAEIFATGLARIIMKYAV